MTEPTPALRAFLTRWDNGAGTFDLAFEGDGKIATKEIKRGGGPAAMVREYLDLDAPERRVVLGALTSADARATFEKALDPQGFATMARFDSNEDFELSAREIERPGFVEAMAALAPEARARYLGTIGSRELDSPVVAELARRFPDLYDPRSVGTALYASKADRQRGEMARKVLTDKLGVDIAGITGGLQRSHLAHLPEHAVPATPTEALVAKLRERLTTGPMDLQQVGRFLADNPLETPTVEADALAEALAREPQRFMNQRLRVVGYAEEVSRRRYTTMTYGPKYDVMDGELKFGWKTASVMETKHKLYSTRERHGPGVLVYDKETASSFMTVGWVDFSRANAAELGGRTWTLEGTVRSSREGPRLVLRSVKTK